MNSSEAPSHAEIESLLISATIEGKKIVWTFRCPRSVKTVEARADLAKAAQDSPLGRVKQTLRTSLVRGAKTSMGRSLRGMLGSGTAGRVGQELLKEGAASAETMTWSAAERERAAVHAFMSVRSQFVEDGDGWVHKEAMSEG